MIISIYIDEVAYEVINEECILQICKKFDIYIPHLCNLKNTLPSGVCSLCVIEVDGSFGLACKIRAQKSMKIVTKSPQLFDIRKSNLLRILCNHRLNCLTCLKSGSCKLQKYAARMGISHDNSFVGKKSFNNPVYIEKIAKHIIFDKSQCIHCQRCIKFLSCICNVSISMLSELNQISNLSKSVDLIGNILDLCPSVALFQENQTICSSLAEKLQTFDVSNIFTPNIAVLKYDNKIINISHIKSIWITDKIKFVYEKLCKRNKVNQNYADFIKRLSSDVLSISSEKKIFMLGDNIDLQTFLYIKYMAKTLKNVEIVIDNHRIPKHIIQEIGFLDQSIARMDFAIHVGNKFLSDIYYVNNMSNSLLHSLSVEFKELEKFILQSKENEKLFNSLRHLYLFLYSDFFKEHNVDNILKIVKKTQKEYFDIWGYELHVKIVPRTMSQIYSIYLDKYLPLHEMLKQYNVHDVKFIFLIGDMQKCKADYNHIPVIQHSVLAGSGKFEHLPSAHFLEESGFYMNIMGEIVETTKILQTELKSNKELIFDLMQEIYEDKFFDINEDIKKELRENFLSMKLH